MKLESLQCGNLKVDTDLSALAQVLAWFDQFTHPAMPHTVWLQCQLALAEGFTNAVRHAHKDKPPETPIILEAALFKQSLEIRIWDCGTGFDLEQVLNSMPQEIDHNAEGGRGLMLMKRVADRLTYTRTPDQKNCLLIVKNFTKP